MLDPARNVERAAADLRDKFDHFVLGATGGTRADDRLAEIGEVALRLCRYPPNDPKYLRDCRRCALEATSVTLGSNTPLFPGAAEHFQPTPYHPEPHYRGVPDRKTFGCDWPYAVRRYNGSGVNSYHYQAQVLIRLARDSTLAALLTP